MSRPSRRTEKVLFARSGNRCACPGCDQLLTHQEEPCAAVTVVGEVCHIHGRREGSPRWNPTLSEEERNAYPNLILLCPNHHKIVDGDPKTYTVDVLREWKSDHESRSVAAEIEALAGRGQSDAPLQFPTSLVDQKIEKDLGVIRQGRLFLEFDTAVRCLEFGAALTAGDYAGGTEDVRGRALAWCARLLGRSEELGTAREYLRLARSLGAQEEVAVAAALVRSHEGDHRKAFGALAHLDSPMACSARLIVAADEGGPKGVIRWARDAGVEAAELDSDGKAFLLACLLESREWDSAWRLLDAVTAHDQEQAPAVIHPGALAELLRTVPDEFREVVWRQVPFFAARFPLASDAAALRHRLAAAKWFRAAVHAARELGCSTAAAAAEEYALWLELLDPERRAATQVSLASRLSDPQEHLRLVPLALWFGVEVDLKRVDQEIRREIARSGGSTPVAAVARLALAATRRDPGTFAEYLSEHRGDLKDHFDETELRTAEVEFLALAGHVKEARSRLDQLIGEGLSSGEAKRLRSRVAEAESEDALTSARQMFAETGSLPDLMVLVLELSAQGPSSELCDYAEKLFQLTRNLEHAETLAKALTALREHERLADFLAENEELAEGSDILRLCRCWSLFWSGSLLEAKAALDALSDCQDYPQYRALQVDLAIGLGDWQSLFGFVEAVYQARGEWGAEELLGAVEIAVAIDAERAWELAAAAATKAGDNTEVLVALYVLATRAGWDDRPLVASWLERAAELAGSDGPVRRVTLEVLLKEAPKLRERQETVWKKLERGDVPAFAAVEVAGSSLAELMLLPAISNRAESDPRRRRAIPAFSGKRSQVRCELGGQAGFDVTALLTLGLLGLLDKVLGVFDKVHLPLFTLKWLFLEQQKARFHQPSRIADARQLRELLDGKTVTVFERTLEVDRRLAAQVGDDLALLVREAETSVADGRQRFVVRPFPVLRYGSAMDEEVDLSSHSAVLSGCQPVVDTLRESGLLTDEQYRDVTAYLRLNEKRWPDQPAISGPAHLYLDDLALEHFTRCGILELLHDGGFTTFVTRRAASEATDLLAYDSHLGEVNRILESVREAVGSRIADGRVLFAPLRLTEDLDDPAADHPTKDSCYLPDRCDVLIFDDRFVNAFPTMDFGDRTADVLTTLDVLDLLASTGVISSEDRLFHRTSLRRAGYLFVPLDQDEVLSHLANANLEDGRVRETQGLRGVRESVLLARVGNVLQLPNEWPWLNGVLEAFEATLRDLWLDDPDVDRARAQSDWILDQIDLRGWAHRFHAWEPEQAAESAQVKRLFGLLLPDPELTSASRERYWEWVEDRLLGPVRATEPTVYSKLAGAFLEAVSQGADEAASRMKADDE